MTPSQKTKVRYDYQTPTQILTNHPKIKRLYTPQQLGYLLMCKAVDGKKLRRGCVISESDLLNFLKWRFNIDGV